ncbi:MAG: heme biosynthesis HemY N-terminal domain-containing protein [Hyphomicrobiales bacterium]
MWRMLLRFIVIIALAVILAQLADGSGTVGIDWSGYIITMSAFTAGCIILVLIAAIMMLWRLLRALSAGVSTAGGFFAHRRRQKGRDALSKGMLAAGCGDLGEAVHYTRLAVRNHRSDDPLLRCLRAQTAQLEGNRKQARRVYDEMTQHDETRTLGLRGLFNQSREDGRYKEARGFAEQALVLNPQLNWASSAMLAIHCAESNWPAVIDLIDTQKRNGLFDAKAACRKIAVVKTAQAIESADQTPNDALKYALKAHDLAPDLAPAAEIACRLLGERGNTSKAMRVVEKTWQLNPHRTLLEAYARLRPDERAKSRLKRVRKLIERCDGGEEGSIALARIAMEVGERELARESLSSLVDERPSVSVCSLMAEIESGDAGDDGKVREWLARAVRAPRDKAWVAQGYVSGRWLPVSPLTGALDAFSWRYPPESISEHGEANKFVSLHTPALTSQDDGMTTDTDNSSKMTEEAAKQPISTPDRDSTAAQGQDARSPDPSAAIAGDDAEEFEAESLIPHQPDDPGPDRQTA